MKEIKRYGLLGGGIGYSLSPEIFSAIFRREQLPYSYEIVNVNLDLEDDEDARLMEHILQDGWAGLNVTIPYKTDIISFLDKTDEFARYTNAVNTIVFRNGKRTGYNTDIDGFDFLFRQMNAFPENGVMILGTGASSRTVKYVLRQYDIPVIKVGRNPDKADYTYEELDKDLIRRNLMIVNTTPLGGPKFPDEVPPVPYQYLTPEHVLVDLNYRPRPTGFLRAGKPFTQRLYDGFPMLMAQALHSWKLWKREA